MLVGWVEVAWLGGPDRLDFLQRMSTARLDDLRPGEGRATAVVDDAGRVVDLVSAHLSASGLALIGTGPGAAAVVAAHLKRYVLFQDQVRVTDASGQVTVLRLVGPDAPRLAAAAAGIDVAPLPSGGWREAGTGDDTVWVMRHPDPGGLGGVDVVVPAGAPAEAMAAKLRAAGAAPIDGGDYARLRIAAGAPAFGHEHGGGPDGDAQANPLELGLRAVVDFAKGCYIGQEVIARLENYEKVQRHLVRLRAGAPLAAGDAVHPAADGPPRRRPRPGRVTTAVADGAGGAGGWVALALVPMSLAAGGRAVVETGAGRVELEIGALS